MLPAKRILALPLILLALVVQGLTPAAAAVMTARLADPFSSLPICSSAPQDGKAAPDAPSDHRGQLCAACSVCSAPAALVTPEAPVIAPPLVVRVVAKPAVEIVGPRGPPRLQPRARGPPLNA